MFDILIKLNELYSVNKPLGMLIFTSLPLLIFNIVVIYKCITGNISPENKEQSIFYMIVFNVIHISLLIYCIKHDVQV